MHLKLRIVSFTGLVTPRIGVVRVDPVAIGLGQRGLRKGNRDQPDFSRRR
jgi:hypothetical protein